MRIWYKLDERLKYCEVTFRCIHGDKNLVSRDRSGRIKVSVCLSVCLSVYLSIYLIYLSIYQTCLLVYAADLR